MSTQAIQTTSTSTPATNSGLNEAMSSLVGWLAALKDTVFGAGHTVSAAAVKYPWLTISVATVVAAVCVVVMIQFAWPAVVGVLLSAGVL
jgi:hypothetical protein